MKTYQLKVEKLDDSEWYYVRCTEVKGLSAFGPDLEECLNGILASTALLFKDRGQNVIASLDYENQILRVAMIPPQDPGP